MEKKTSPVMSQEEAAVFFDDDKFDLIDVFADMAGKGVNEYVISQMSRAKGSPRMDGSAWLRSLPNQKYVLEGEGSWYEEQLSRIKFAKKQ